MRPIGERERREVIDLSLQPSWEKTPWRDPRAHEKCGAGGWTEVIPAVVAQTACVPQHPPKTALALLRA